MRLTFFSNFPPLNLNFFKNGKPLLFYNYKITIYKSNVATSNKMKSYLPMAAHVEP